MKTIVVTGVFLLLFSCGVHKPAYKGTAFKKHLSLEKTGFKKSTLEEITQYLKLNSETTGMLVLHDGKVVYEYGNIEEVSYNASCRKSILSMLYGKYVENGTIDLNQTIGDIGIDEKDELLPQEKEATVNDIITARSGVFHIPANGGYDTENVLKRGSVKHGEYFLYNNWDFNVAGYILENKSGNSIYKELEEQLAIPLGFQDWNIKNQKKKHNQKKSKYPAYHMYLSTRDMAKIGQLMLNKGVWNGKQLVSEEWIEKIITTVTPKSIVNKRYNRNEDSPVQLSYGYYWWLIDVFKENQNLNGAYSASGWGGQYITVFPKQNVVVVLKTKMNKLVLWGLKGGGTSDWQYWKVINMLFKDEN